MMKLRAVQQTGGEDVVAGYEPEGEMIEEIEMTRKAYSKIHKDFKSDNPKKPRTTKYVPGKGTVSMPVKFVDEAKYEAGASDYGKMSIRNKRAVGYGGNAAPPEERRKAHTVRMKKHMTNKGKSAIDPKKNPMAEATRYAKETGKSFKSGKPMVKGGTAKDDKAFQAVAKKYAGQMMGGQQKKKVRGQKPDESNTPFKRAAARVKQIKTDNKALADKAKKAGYKSTQDYVNVQAVRKGGLGT